MNLITFFIVCFFVYLLVKIMGSIYLSRLERLDRATFADITYQESGYRNKMGNGQLLYIKIGRQGHPFSLSAETDYSDIVLWYWNATKKITIPLCGYVLEFDPEKLSDSQPQKVLKSQLASGSKLIIVTRNGYLPTAHVTKPAN